MYAVLWIVLGIIGLRALTWMVNAIRVKTEKPRQGSFFTTGTLYVYHPGTMSFVPPGMRDVVITIPEAPRKPWIIQASYYCFGKWRSLSTIKIPGHCRMARIQLFLGFGPATFRFDVAFGEFMEAPEEPPTLTVEDPQANVTIRYPTNPIQRFLGL